MKGLRLRSDRGLLLVECVVYLAAFLVLLTVAFAGFYAAWDHHKRLARNARQILQVTDVGERWRQDVRQASEPVQLQEDGQGMTLRAAAGHEIVYRFASGQLWRSETTNQPILMLDGVKQSTMRPVIGEYAKAWRWELELQGAQKAARVAPLFVFTAVDHP